MADTDLMQKRLKPAALLLLVLLLLVAGSLSVYLSQLLAGNPQQQSAESQQQQVSQQAAALAKIINGWQQQAADQQAVKDWPDVDVVCMIDSIPMQPQSGDCLPITFTTLLALRQATDDGQADVAVMQPGTDEAYVQIVRKLNDGYLLLALDINILKKLTQTLDANAGYWTVNQGSNANLVLLRAGDQQFAQEGKPVSSKINGSHWQLNFWPMPPATSSFNPVWLLPALLLALIIWWPLAGLLPSGRKKRPHNKAPASAVPVTDNKPAPVKEPAVADNDELPVEKHPDVAAEIKTPAADAAAEKTAPAEPENVDLLYDEAFDRPRSSDLDETVGAQASPEVLEFNVTPAAVKPAAIDAAIFKTYDIRGIVDSQLNASVMQQLGQAIGSEAQARGVQKMVVARDGRASSEDFANAMMTGLNDSGCDVIDIGAMPTPVLYFAAEHFETGSGVMITGSHNPANYNGVKIVIGGETLSGDAIRSLKQRLDNQQLAKGQGTRQIEEVLDEYLATIAAQIKLPKAIKVVVDCGNGIAGVVAPQLLKIIGCDVTPLFCDVDSRFPNHHPNPGQPENLQALIDKVQETKADLGLAFDGDGDRLGVVMADGEIVWPDRLLMLFAQALLAEYPGEIVLFDVKSTGLLHDTISRAGGKPKMVASGHSLIKKALQENNAKLAGELSGHLFFADRWYGFDDALYAACRLLELLAADPDRTPTQIFAAQPQRVNTPEIHIAMDETECRQFMQRFIEKAQFSDARLTKIDGLRADFANGWGLARASNTVPGLTLRFEAGTEADLQHIKQLFVQQMLQVKPTLSLHL